MGSRAGVMFSVIVHGTGALAVATLLAQPVVFPEPEPDPVRLVELPPAAPAPPPVAAPKPQVSRPRPDAPKPEVKPIAVESQLPPAAPERPAIVPPPEPPPPIPLTPPVLITSQPVVPQAAPTNVLAPAPPGNFNEQPVAVVDTQPQTLRAGRPAVPVGASGTIVVRVIISSKGVVTRAQVLTETPFREAVEKAAYETVFRPALVRNRAVAFETTITFVLNTRR
jgi:outer membrane biosynthesis protein TonB